MKMLKNPTMLLFFQMVLAEIRLFALRQYGQVLSSNYFK